MFTSLERYLCVPYFTRAYVQQDTQRALKRFATQLKVNLWQRNTTAETYAYLCLRYARYINVVSRGSNFL